MPPAAVPIMTASDPIYLDNHSTTRVDPRVVEAMLPFFLEQYGNAGSPSHRYGWDAREAVDRSRRQIAAAVNAKPTEIVFTSGATESNNLAILGAARRRQARGKHLIGVTTEHRAVLDPLLRLERDGYEVTYLDVYGHDQPAACGQLNVEDLRAAIRSDTDLVTVMLANNEIGVIQPLREIADVCHQHDVLLHCDATQAVGKLPVDVHDLGVDLMSFSAHKLHGPKGIGALYVRRRSPQIRLLPQLVGGGQEKGLRSGTLAVPLIVGFATAVSLCVERMDHEIHHFADLRGQLFTRMVTAIPDVYLNGPQWSEDGLTCVRLPNNLNLRFEGVDGESLMLSAAKIAVSTGSACTSTSPEPSHVLRAIGLTEDQTRSSLRFGFGRFNSENELEPVVDAFADAVNRLRKMG